MKGNSWVEIDMSRVNSDVAVCSDWLAVNHIYRRDGEKAMCCFLKKLKTFNTVESRLLEPPDYLNQKFELFYLNSSKQFPHFFSLKFCKRCLSTLCQSR